MISVTILGDYALSIRDYNQFKGVYVIHYKIITRIDGRVYIAGRTLRSFTSIIELVDHYKGLTCFTIFYIDPKCSDRLCWQKGQTKIKFVPRVELYLYAQ